MDNTSTEPTVVCVNLLERNGAANIIMALQRLEKGHIPTDKALASIRANAERLLRYMEQFNKAQASGATAPAWHEAE